MRRGRARVAGLTGLALAVLLQLGCSIAEPPVLEPLVERSTRRPVVLVPGVTGVKLRDAESGRIVWGRGVDLLKPHDGGYAFARPLSSDERGRSALEASGVIEEIRLLGGLIRKQVYGPIVRLMEANGYRRGDLTRPTPGDDFFLFAWDWRDDLTVAAAELYGLLDRLRQVRGEEVLEVDLICQSAGGQICRYLAKYGGLSLESAEAARSPVTLTVRVPKAIFVGTANGGSLRILREIHRGRSYIPGIGRKILPEVLFTFPSLFQDLPVYREELFVDGAGAPLDLDLLDADVWREYGFSVFGAAVRGRLDRSAPAAIFGDDAERSTALERFLDLGRRLHAVLGRDVAGFESRYYSIQNVDDETPDRAVLMRGATGGWELLFTGDKRLRKNPELHAAVTTGGDGHAAEASQHWLSPQESAALAVPTRHVRGDHFEMILDRRALEAILEFLAD